MALHFKLQSAYNFGWPGIEGFAYNSSKDFARASAARFAVTGRHGKVKSTISDRVYLVLEGSGRFVIGQETIAVQENDVIIVPCNTDYDYEGTMSLFLVHSPAYNEQAEITLE